MDKNIYNISIRFALCVLVGIAFHAYADENHNVELSMAYSKTFRPTTTNNVVITIDQLSAGNDTMVGVFRYRNDDVRISGLDIPKHDNVGFDVIAFNDDHPGAPAENRRGSQVEFTPDGTSHYEVIVMPYRGAGRGTARITIAGCAGCGFENQEFSETFDVLGTVIRNQIGNIFKVTGFISHRGGVNPSLYAFRVNRDSQNGFAGVYKGYGVFNKDYKGAASGPQVQIKDSTIALQGLPGDILLLSAEYPVMPNPSRPAKADVVVETGPILGYDSPPDVLEGCVAPADEASIPDILLDTGCTRRKLFGDFDPSDLVAYDVAHPFWSDGVEKGRYISLPENTSIDVGLDGQWTMPPGGVLVKTFTFNEVLFEVRFVAKTLSGKKLAYSYRYDSTARNFVRVDNVSPTPTIQLAPDFVWSFPSTGQCADCHKVTASDEDFFLGLKSKQFNMDYYYSHDDRSKNNGYGTNEDLRGHANQIDTLVSIGLLSGPGLATKIWPGFAPRPDTYQGQNLKGKQEQARAWLDVNCAYCHRDGYVDDSWLPSHNLSFVDTKACDTKPRFPNENFLIWAGMGDLSFIVKRANARGSFLQMPPLATDIVDSEGVSAVVEWIDSLGQCEPVEQKIVNQNAQNCLTSSVVGAASMTSCANAQNFTLVDEGNSQYAIQKPDGDCVNYVSATNVAVGTCTGGQWRREWLATGDDYQLRSVQNDDVCLTASGASVILEACKEKPGQRWLGSNE